MAHGRLTALQTQLEAALADNRAKDVEINHLQGNLKMALDELRLAQAENKQLNREIGKLESR